MREIVHIQAGQCGNQIGAKVRYRVLSSLFEARVDVDVAGAMGAWPALRSPRHLCKPYKEWHWLIPA